MHQNRWNQIVYARWAPFYDALIGLPFFVRERRRALAKLDLQRGERVLIPGVGTGQDLPFLPDGIRATGIDLSDPMLAKARARLPIPGRDVTLQRGNAEALPFDDDSFDAAILSLILSVVGDPESALRETMRVLRPGGRAVIFDKFLPTGKEPSLFRRLINALIMRPFGTDINCQLEPLLARVRATLVSDEPSLFRGSYRIVGIRK
jgi:ubiquinone/menaquinone biosynthesis C-methylase UbiE